jgi:hypothetical protein
MVMIKAPARLGSREQAEELVASVSHDLKGETVVVSFQATIVARPSFIDEMIRQILVERGASQLILEDLPSGARETVNRSAVYRNLISKITIRTAS